MRSTVFLIAVALCAVVVLLGGRSTATIAPSDDDTTATELALSVNEDTVEVMADNSATDDSDAPADDDDGPVESVVDAEEANKALETTDETKETITEEGNVVAVVPTISEEVAPGAAAAPEEGEKVKIVPQKAKTRAGKYMSYDDYFSGNLDVGTMGTDVVGDPNYNYGKLTRIPLTFLDIISIYSIIRIAFPGNVVSAYRRYI